MPVNVKDTTNFAIGALPVIVQRTQQSTVNVGEEI